MSFLSNIFKKKPGGTALGNIIRGVVSHATFGLAGNGKNMIPAEGDTPAIGAGDLSGTVVQPTTGPFDLNKLITLPTLNTSSSVDNTSLLKIAGIGLGAILLFKALSNGNGKR